MWMKLPTWYFFLAGFSNCLEIYNADNRQPSGVYTLRDGSGANFDVYCNMSIRGLGGWTVIQRRTNSSTTFDRTWQEYKNGFGDPTTNHWVGLQRIRDVVTSSPSGSRFQLYVGLESLSPIDPYAFAFYESFSLDDEQSNYTLRVSEASEDSSAGDSLHYHSGKQFSTPDRDNDMSYRNNCAQRFNTGWWFGNCHDSLLNGRYYDTGVLADLQLPDGIMWDTWATDRESLKSAFMAIRPL